MSDLFDVAAMYDDDYLYFFAAPPGLSEVAAHGPVVPGDGVPGEAAAELAWRLAGLDSSAVFLDRARAGGPARLRPPRAAGPRSGPVIGTCCRRAGIRFLVPAVDSGLRDA